VTRAAGFVNVDAASEATRAELVGRYRPGARGQLDEIRAALEDAIGRKLADAAGADRISADVRAVTAAFESLGWLELKPFGAEREALKAVASAYAAGTGEAFNRPDVQAVMTGLRFVNPLDAKTTDICRKRTGTTLPLDHPWWFSNWPPLHYGCRSVVVPLTGNGVKFTDDPPESPPPDPGWGRWAGMLTAFQTAQP
jgi:SPP1 gp7 family putative phage head morphogenesis protein